MKHTSLFSIACLTSMMLHASEENKQIQFWHHDSSYNAVSQALLTDYEQYVKNRLTEYKKTDFTVQDMNAIKEMCTTFTGNPTAFKRVICANGKDEEDNTFTHIAIKKVDTEIFTWLMHSHQNNNNYPCNKNKQYFMDICIDHLSPQSPLSHDDKYRAYAMLEYLTLHYKEQLAQDIRKQTLEKLISLKIMLQQRNDRINLKDPLFENLVKPKDTQESPLDLAELYQQVADPETGNTLSHTFIDLYNADGLYDLLQRNYISAKKNKDNLSVLELALKNFQVFTQDPSQFDLYPERAQNARCCLFMLLRYIRSKDNTYITSLYKCCEKHVITESII